MNLNTLLLILLLFFSACTKKNPAQTDPLAENNKNQTQAKSSEVNLAIWGNYISPEVQEKFTKTTGIRLNISNYSSNEELLAKVQSGASGLDVAVPSDYMVGVMIKLGLLLPITAEKIEFRGDIIPEVLKQPYDPENKFSYPYALSTTGIAINRDLFKTKIATWKEFFENPELTGKVSMLDDVREVMGAALKAKGYSVNTTNEAELAEAKKLILASKFKIKMFRSDTMDALVNKEIAVAQAYSADALQAARKNNSNIEYYIPEDGGTKAIDNLVIISGAKHVEEAHKLISFLLSPDSNFSFVNNVLAAPVLKTTKARLSADLQKNTSLFPTAKTYQQLEAIVDLGDKTNLYDRIWTEIKAQ